MAFHVSIYPAALAALKALAEGADWDRLPIADAAWLNRNGYVRVVTLSDQRAFAHCSRKGLLALGVEIPAGLALK